ncbi:fucolectin-like isoform X2 [Pecten maximus]|uniref:fucolectin-like isoform X2 n=1 Tax=Pecten maximus TaxID=6579 RepID=UPI0014580B1B|nr:fucolectin-like isoform X2 [Pecten maximus]
MATRTLGRRVILSLFFIIRTIRSEGDISIHKPAEQSSNNNSILVASKAVDNCLHLDLKYECCTLTNTTGQKIAWWRVDLLEVVTISWISLYVRNGSQPKLAGYQIYASNTTTSPTDGVLCYSDNSSTEADVQLVAHHTCPHVARYVTVYNYRNDPKRYDWYSDYAILELCKVTVKDCSTGKYGNRCQNNCSANCKDSLCSIDSGYCLDCVPGNFGDKCELSLFYQLLR